MARAVGRPDAHRRSRPGHRATGPVPCYPAHPRDGQRRCRAAPPLPRRHAGGCRSPVVPAVRESDDGPPQPPWPDRRPALLGLHPRSRLPGPAFDRRHRVGRRHDAARGAATGRATRDAIDGGARSLRRAGGSRTKADCTDPDDGDGDDPSLDRHADPDRDVGSDAHAERARRAPRGPPRSRHARRRIPPTLHHPPSPLAPAPGRNPASPRPPAIRPGVRRPSARRPPVRPSAPGGRRAR